LWELEHGLNPDDSSDDGRDRGDGWTYLEEYLHRLTQQ
jgi:hypothetical protein